MTDKSHEAGSCRSWRLIPHFAKRSIALKNEKVAVPSSYSRLSVGSTHPPSAQTHTISVDGGLGAELALDMGGL